MFSDVNELLRVLIVTPIIYFTIILFLRISGKRSLASLNAFDMLVTVALGSLLGATTVSDSVPLTEGMLAIATLLLLQWLVSRGSVASSHIRKLVRGSPRLLVDGGQFRSDAADRERVTRAEVEEAMRKAGFGRFEEIEALVLETDGSFSVIGRTSQPLDALSEVCR